MGKSKASYENWLNDLYSDMSQEEAVYALIYLTSKRRGKHTTTANLKKQHRSGKLGSLVKRLDPIAFSCGYNDYK
jgi:hypothetical protein